MNLISDEKDQLKKEDKSTQVYSDQLMHWIEHQIKNAIFSKEDYSNRHAIMAKKHEEIAIINQKNHKSLAK